ncbi:Uncharacterised protein [Mycobacteroides abscessus subsp. abscessus]|nr:Uncharacterised protein [Mycobacteroides abscessus subsp. abscessus]
MVGVPITVGIGEHQIEQQGPAQVATFEVHTAEGPCPGDADRIPLAAFHPHVPLGAGLDPRGIEGVRVHQPPGSLAEVDAVETTSGTGGEVLVAVRHIRDEFVQ